MLVELESLELLEELLLEPVVESDVASRPMLFAAAMNVATSSVELEEELELPELVLLVVVLLELLVESVEEPEPDEVEVDELLMIFAVPAGVWSVLPVRPMYAMDSVVGSEPVTAMQPSPKVA